MEEQGKNGGKTEKTMMRAEVLSQEALTEDIYSLWLAAGPIARAARPGQFLSVYTDDSGHLLPRPISFCEIDPENGRVRLVYRVVGEGTRYFCALKAGDTVRVLGPMGNGFATDSKKKTLLIGGGIGIAPLLALAEALPGERQIVLGYQSTPFLHREFLPYGPVFVATEDGSSGIRGNVLDAVRENALLGEVICACGPTPMLRAVKSYAASRNVSCYLSLEERMACGIGACLSCVCRSAGVDGHTRVHSKRVCCDGPVFPAGEVEL